MIDTVSKMKKKRFIFCVVATFLIVSQAFSQTLTEPKLTGSWIGGEDFGEFIYHKTEELGYLLVENPNGKIVARLCSKNRISLALVSSAGFAFTFPSYTETLHVPTDRVFFSRSSECGEKSEQYWFVPENSAFRYDEMIPAKNVHVRRFIEDYHDNPASRVAQKEFSDNTRLFIDELKRDARAEGFIIRNLRTKNGGLQRVLKELESEKVDLSRIQTIRKTRYITYYPELMTVTISPQ